MDGKGFKKAEKNLKNLHMPKKLYRRS